MTFLHALKVVPFAGLCGVLALIACGPSDYSNQAQKTAVTTEAQTGPVTYQFALTMPGTTAMVSTTVAAAQAVYVDRDASILGPVASAGRVDLEPKARTNGIAASADVNIDPLALVQGNLAAGGSVHVEPLSRVTGTATPFDAATAPYEITWSVTNPGGSQGPISLDANAIGAPSPGVYDAVVAKTGSTLYLNSGTYFLQSLDLEPGSKFLVDSRNGPVFVYLSQGITFRGSEQAPDASLPQLFVGDFGTSDAVFDAPFTGIFLAPSAAIRLGSSCHHDGHLPWQGAPPWQGSQPWYGGRGNDDGGSTLVHTAAFYGSSVEIGPGQVVNPVYFDWQDIPGLPIPVGGWLANGGPTGRGGPGTTGGTGSGDVPTSTVAISASGINLTLNVDPQTGTGSATPVSPPTTCVPFTLPSTFDVGGELANGTVTVSFTNTVKSTTQAVTCTYTGGASTAYPSTPQDLNAGRTATLKSCSDNLPTGALRCGSAFNVSAQAPVGWPLSIHLALDSRSCDASFEIMTPLQTRVMHDSFSWPSADLPYNTLVTENFAAETNPPSANVPFATPALYYAWVYVKSPTDILMLRKLYVHMLPGPLFTDEITPFAGKCGTFTNPGDGLGQFIPVLMPGKVYNQLLSAQNTQYQQQNHIDASQGSVFFDAVVLRTSDVPDQIRNSNNSVDVYALVQSGFQYLDYESYPLPTQADIQLSGGVVTNLEALAIDVTTWLLNAVATIGNDITTALGAIDALFAGRITLAMTINSGNFNPLFGDTTTPMIRAWGLGAGSPVAAGGLKITVQENTFGGLIPETFNGTTDDSGDVVIRPAKHGSGDVAGVALCIHMSNKAAVLTDFLQTLETCDFSAWTSLPSPTQTQINSPAPLIPSVDQDQNLYLVIGNGFLNVLLQMSDAYKWSTDVAGYSPSSARVLVGPIADVMTYANGNRAFTDCFYHRNVATAYLDFITTGEIQGFLDGLTYLLPASALVTQPVQAILNYLQNADIIIPNAPATGADGNSSGREVGSHEYGHFLLCNLAENADKTAIDGLVIGTAGALITSQSDNYSDSVRYINEAFADFVSGQVTSIANYGWLRVPGGKVCASGAKSPDRPCFDENFTGSPQGKTDTAGIARIASLIHDAFDHAPSSALLSTPDDADAWRLDPSSDHYVYDAVSWGSFDQDANGACRPGTGQGTSATCVGGEPVALGGQFFVDFGENIARFAGPSVGANEYLTDSVLYQALDATMRGAGWNWCQRCDVLALHTPANASDNLTAKQLLETCSGPNIDPFLLLTNLPSGGPPAPYANLDATTCTPCPPSYAPDDNGVCQYCPYTVIGDDCVQCPANATINGLTDPPPGGPLTASYTATWDTPSNTSATCPGWFWLEVDRPDGFFARGATSLRTSVSLYAPTQQTCQTAYELDFQDQPAGTFVTELRLVQTGSYSAGGLEPCTGLPAITTTQLSYGTAPIRFGTPVVSGVSMDFAATVPTVTQ